MEPDTNDRSTMMNSIVQARNKELAADTPDPRASSGTIGGTPFVRQPEPAAQEAPQRTGPYARRPTPENG